MRHDQIEFHENWIEHDSKGKKSNSITENEDIVCK